MAQHFKDPIVWQKDMDLVTEIYKLTDGFPKREVYSLTDQSGAPRFPSRAISQKAKRTTAVPNSVITSGTPPVRSPSLRPSYSSRSVWDMPITLPLRAAFNEFTRSEEF